MKISPISVMNYNTKSPNVKRNNDSEEIPTETQPNFKAHLKVSSTAEEAIKGSLSKFREACYLLGQKLEAETLHKSDVVWITRIYRSAKSVPTGELKTSKENLEIAINDSSTGFYYNDTRSTEQIAEDMFNAYKHVRYVEHYENPGIIDSIKNWFQS